MIHLFSEKFPLKYNVPGIYYIQINSHSYVGSSNQIIRRLREHKKKLTHNYHDNKFMQRAYNKYKDGGKIYYQILEICSQDELKNREKYWIDKLHPDINIVQDPTMENTTCLYNSSGAKPVYQYSLTGEYIGEFPSVSEAGRQLNKNSRIISQAASDNSVFKSAHGYQWSYHKVDKMSYYVNNSSKATNKKVEILDTVSGLSKIYNSIADAARGICEPQDNFNSICASISGICRNKGKLVKHRYKCKYL